LDFPATNCLNWRVFQLNGLETIRPVPPSDAFFFVDARNRPNTLGILPGARNGELAGMPTGTIARLLIDKGFGFIRDEGGIEHFFHRSSVRGAVFELLREGQRVEFTPEESGQGPRAGVVRLIEGWRASTPGAAVTAPPSGSFLFFFSSPLPDAHGCTPHTDGAGTRRLAGPRLARCRRRQVPAARRSPATRGRDLRARWYALRASARSRRSVQGGLRAGDLAQPGS